MKATLRALVTTIELILWLCFLGALYFVFHGDPSVWDTLRGRVMQACTTMVVHLVPALPEQRKTS